jgi:hypothetical protein
VIRGQSKTAGKNHSDGSRRVLHGGYLFEIIATCGLRLCKSRKESLVPSSAVLPTLAQGAAGTEAPLLDYIGMQGHLNRKQFNRCAWSAALMLAGSAAAILGAIGYLAK